MQEQRYGGPISSLGHLDIRAHSLIILAAFFAGYSLVLSAHSASTVNADMLIEWHHNRMEWS